MGTFISCLLSIITASVGFIAGFFCGIGSIYYLSPSSPLVKEARQIQESVDISYLSGEAEEENINQFQRPKLHNHLPSSVRGADPDNEIPKKNLPEKTNSDNEQLKPIKK
jgi:hypothetical protein